MRPSLFFRQPVTAMLVRCRPASSKRSLCSSSAVFAERLLKEGAESSASMTSGLPGPSLPALEALCKALQPRPVSLLMLKGSARDRSLKNRLLQANFVRRELITRRCHILTLLHTMPEPLAGRESLVHLAGVYWERLQALLNGPGGPVVEAALTTEADERAFLECQRERNEQIAALGTCSEEEMCVSALEETQRELGVGWWSTHPQERLAVDRQLDAILLARIGLRFLLEHYVACEAPRDGYAGIIENALSPVKACEEAVAEVQAELRAQGFGAVNDAANDSIAQTATLPPIEIRGDGSQTFTFVPSHFKMVVRTLLKNSCVATLRHHHRLGGSGDGGVDGGGCGVDAALNPVRIIVAASDDAVQLKLEDRAGGIRRSSLINIWSYRSLQSTYWKPVDGISLPLARLYCKYFGGSLALVPMEGYGTDCYVLFNRLAHANTERVYFSHAREVEAEDRLGNGLFDAQHRRIRPASSTGAG